MKTVLYARNSLSEDIQKTSMKSQNLEGELTALKHKLFIDERYLDSSVSARSNNSIERPALHRLLCDIRSGLVKSLIVYRRCRLARNLSEHLEIYELFWKHGIEVLFSAEGEPPMIYSEEGEILEAIFGAKNEIEGDKIVHGIITGQRSKAKEGKKPTGIASFGYRYVETSNKKEKGILRKEENEEPVVKDIFRIFLSEDFSSFASFVRYLKSREIIPHNWKDTRVRGMFGNQLYNGVLYFDDIQTPVPHLLIIDDFEWGLIREKYANNYSTGRKNSKHNVIFLLENKITCGLCELPMETRKYNYKDVEGFYECKEHARKVKKKLSREVVFAGS